MYMVLSDAFCAPNLRPVYFKAGSGYGSGGSSGSTGSRAEGTVLCGAGFAVEDVKVEIAWYPPVQIVEELSLSRSLALSLSLSLSLSLCLCLSVSLSVSVPLSLSLSLCLCFCLSPSPAFSPLYIILVR
jgi:hypothetical protein